MTKAELVEKAANGGSYTTDRLYEAYDRYANGFVKPVGIRKRKAKNEKDRNSRNKKTRQSRSL